MSDQEPTFEQALQELEDVIARLEAGAGTLDETMALFERGQKLVAQCGAALDQGMGTLSSGQASLKILQGEVDYLEKDSANSEAAKGLDEAQAALRQGTVLQASDRASMLLAANLASAVDTAPYAKGVQAALRASPLSKRKGPIADFLALAPPERSRSSKRDFVQAFQAAEKALWKADLDAEPLNLARLKPEDLGGDWDRPVNATPMVPFLDVFSEAAYQRVIEFDETSAGKTLSVPVKLTAQVDSTR